MFDCAHSPKSDELFDALIEILVDAVIDIVLILIDYMYIHVPTCGFWYVCMYVCM